MLVRDCGLFDLLIFDRVCRRSVCLSLINGGVYPPYRSCLPYANLNGICIIYVKHCYDTNDLSMIYAVQKMMFFFLVFLNMLCNFEQKRWRFGQLFNKTMIRVSARFMVDPGSFCNEHVFGSHGYIYSFRFIIECMYQALLKTATQITDVNASIQGV